MLAMGRLILLISVCFCYGALAQNQGQGLPWPLQGQGLPAPNVTTAVLMDVVVDNLRLLNSHENSYTAVHVVKLSWEDSRAAGLIQDATNSWLSKMNNAPDSSVDITAGCARPCDSSAHPSGGCCSTIFIPHIELTNMVYISQESVYKWRIWVDPNNRNRIHFASRVTAEWSSPFDFRAWPFEHQHLLLEAQVAPSLSDRVYLVMGHAAFLTNTPHTKGDAMPGWHVAKVTRRIFKNNACFDITNATSSVWSVSSNMQTVSLNPLNPTSWLHLQPENDDSVILSTSENTTCVPSGGFYPEGSALLGPQQLVVDIMVKRTQLYYVLANVLPLLLLDYMVFLIYAMERSDLEARMGVVVTLVLAVSALQFTYDFPPASYLNAVQQITLTSYCLYFIVALESMIASHICRLHKRKREHAMLMQVAQGRPVMSMQQSLDLGLPTIQEPSPTYDPYPRDSNRRSGNGLRTSADGTTRAYNSPSNVPTPVAYVRDPKTGKPQLHVELFNLPDGTATTPSQSYPVPQSAVEAFEPPMTARRRGPGPVAEAITHSANLIHGPGNQAGFIDGYANDPAARRLGNPDTLRQRAINSVPDPAGPEARSHAHGMCCFSDPEVQVEYEGEGTVRYVPADKAATMKRKGSALSRVLSRNWTRMTRRIPQRISSDEAYAQLFASRLDMWFSWSLLISFTVVVAVLLYVNTQVGDHKLMLQGDKPANM